MENDVIWVGRNLINIVAKQQKKAGRGAQKNVELNKNQLGKRNTREGMLYSLYLPMCVYDVPPTSMPFVTEVQLI